MTVNDFFTNLASGATWAAGVAFQRSNPLPLDKYSVFQSEADLVTYVTTNAVAYPGQIVAVYDATAAEMRAFVISSVGEDGTYIPVGTETVVDGSSIVMKDDGSLAIAGFEAAASLTLPQKQADGSILWVPIEAIVEGDGNTQYTFTEQVEDSSVHFSVKSSDEEEAQIVHLDAYSKSEVEGLIEEAAGAAKAGAEATAASALATARTEISAEIDADVKVAKDRADEAYTLAGTKVDATAYATDKKNLEDEDAAIRAIAEGARDALDTFLNSEDIDETVNTLKEIQAEIEKMTDATELATALAGKADNSTVEGIDNRVKAIEEAPYATKSDVETVDNKFANYTTTEVLTGLLNAKQDTIPEGTYDAFGAAESVRSDLTGAINAKANAADVYTKSEVYTKGEADQAIADKISEVNGGESAGEVLGQLNAYKKIVNMEVWGDEAGAGVGDNGDSRIDILDAKVAALEDVGAQANVIEAVDAAEGAKLAITKNGKTVTVDDSALQSLISTAQTKANDAYTLGSNAQAAAEANAALINANDAAIKLLQAQDTTHTQQIAALVQHDNDHTALYDALNETVGTHGTDIAGLKTGKADVATVEGVTSRVATNEQDIKTLKETTIPAINAEIAKKADASALADYHTKSEIVAITGEVAEGKTIVQMIADAQANATYDDTAVRKLISDEAARAAAAEEANAGAISRIDATLSAALENEGEGLDSIKELAVWIEEHGKEATALAAGIDTNTKAIAAINNVDTGILAQATDYTDVQIAAIPAATASVLGLVKVDDTTVKMNASNQLYVAKVSTDILDQGEQTLVLNGGSAKE